MASIRNFKKDVNYVTSEIVVECFTYNFLFPEKTQAVLANIITETLELRSDLLKKINQIKLDKSSSAKKQANSIKIEFTKQIEGLVKKLEELEKE